MYFLVKDGWENATHVRAPVCAALIKQNFGPIIIVSRDSIGVSTPRCGRGNASSSLARGKPIFLCIVLLVELRFLWFVFGLVIFSL